MSGLGGTPRLDTGCSPHFEIPFPDLSLPFVDSGIDTMPEEPEAASTSFWGGPGAEDMPAGELVYQPSAVAPPTYGRLAALGTVVHKRLRYAIDEIKKAPQVFVQTSGTPWSHVKLYEDEMPKSMRGLPFHSSWPP